MHKLRKTRTRTRCTFVSCLILIGGLATTGCRTYVARFSQWAAKGWVGEYDTAEQHAVEQGREILFHYLDTKLGSSQPLRRVLEDPMLEISLKRYVRCRLCSSYEPDRRYVAQYGILQPPALIIVHQDGTYHALSGTKSASDVKSFLASAREPGQTPQADPLIPRRPRYQWLTSLESVEEAVRTQGRPALIVISRTASPDWLRLKRMLHERQVWRQVCDMIHGQIGVFDWGKKEYDSQRFGALQLPALVILQPSGAHTLLERPQGAEQIAIFAASAGRSTSIEALRRVQPTEPSTAYAAP